MKFCVIASLMVLFCTIIIYTLKRTQNSELDTEPKTEVTRKPITFSAYVSPFQNPPTHLSHYYNKNSPFYGSDLIESNETHFVCVECAKYTKRWFSEYGKNTKYPKLPDYFKQHIQGHEECAIRFCPVLDNVSRPTWEYEGDFIDFCNRAFIDERTQDEKNAFDNYIAEKNRKITIKREYEQICKTFPDYAPKSLGGYSRMKNLNSENYQKIKKLAEENGIEIT